MATCVPGPGMYAMTVLIETHDKATTAIKIKHRPFFIVNTYNLYSI